ncbi:hypothetical protein ACFXPM_19495 [Streptomyces sp. NPDC059095]|uniref:hypothetical protein n=1 Tax=Streptomyces sp. NPDC059095 TaxID=3346726 RepID=UPI003681532F
MSEQGSRYYSPLKDSGIGTYVNHKRMAVLAAVAAVTPTVLVAAPASAEEARPAARSPHGPTRNPLFDTHTRADAPAADPRRQMTSVVREVPDTFEAGGDWGEFTLVVGNLTDHDLSDYDVNLAVDTIHPAPRLVMEHMRVQLRVDGAWVDAPLEQPDRDANVDAALPLDRVILPPGDTAFQVRIRFTSDAPLTFFILGPRPDIQHSPDPVDTWVESEIVRFHTPDPEPTPDPTPPTQTPSPSPSSSSSAAPAPQPTATTQPTPAHDPRPTETGLVGPSEHEPDDPAPTGELAHSGSDAAVTWAVGSAGALLVVGTTLAIAHRHRRAR